MSTSTAEFARSVVDAFRVLDGFSATQIVRAGPIQVTADVRFRRPNLCALEIQSYRSPLLELEERIANGAEFSEEELTGLSITYDGRVSLLFDPRTSVGIEKPSRFVAEPLPGVQAFAEIGFLDALTHDFLIRDAGEETIDDRPARLLGLKPKHFYRSYLLKTTAFPIRRAVVAFDVDTLFPRRIQFFPAENTLLFSLVGSDPVTILYRQVRLETPDTTAFSASPMAGSRLFRESALAGDELVKVLPFPFSLEPFLQAGFHLLNDSSTLLLDEEGERGYCTLILRSEGEEADPPALTLRVGNYLSRNMSRRKKTLAETGEVVQIGDSVGRVLDRSGQWSRNVSAASARTLTEVSWTHDELFWFLTADGLDEEQLIALATEIAKGQATS